MTSLLARHVSAAMALALLTGCASVPPATTGSLTSYGDLAKVRSLRTQAASKADGAALTRARTVRIDPVVFGDALGAELTTAQMSLIANAMERTLCSRLGPHFEVVDSRVDADLTIRTAVTRIRATGAKAAALSAAISLAIPAPRLPIGLGGFAAEAEVVRPDGVQAAALIWSRDADMLSGKRASSIGDAYDLSTKFAQDLSKLIVKERAKGSPQRSHRDAADACGVYGKRPGLTGTVAGLFGAPPEWTDRRQAEQSISSTAAGQPSR